MTRFFRQWMLLALVGLGFLPAVSFADVIVVRTVDHAYIPRDITIREGDTVRWVWEGDTHNVVSGVPYTHDNAFRSPLRNTGFVWEYIFDRQTLNNFRKPGRVYDYYCEPHAADLMLGTITVLRDPTNFVGTLAGWQEVPGNNSSARGDCTATLNADQTSISINCTHNVTNPTMAHLHRGTVGRNGAIMCALNVTGNSVSGTCPLTSEDVEQLFDIALYVNVHSASFPGGEVRTQLVPAAGGPVSVSGRVALSGGQGFPGVTVSDGTRSAVTGANGGFTLSGVPNGVYQLTAVRSGFNIAGVSGTNPVIVNSINVSNRNFVVVADGTCGTDSDRDGICDADELVAGSNPLDAGSYATELGSPIYALWNGFIQLRNILEIVNKGSTPATVTLALRDISGAKVFENVITLQASGQFDVIVNDLPGFQADSFGIVTLSFDESRKGDIDGRMFFYRDDLTSAGFEFAFGVPFERPNFGRSAVTFNTFQPSYNPTEAQNVVAQWLSIVNLDPDDNKSFDLERYNQVGQLIATETVVVPPLGRRDLEAGHVNPGPNSVGLHVIKPLDDIAPYLAQLYRYGGNAAPGEAVTGYNYAFPILARAGNGQVQRAPISVGAGASNWLELANTLSTPVQVTLEAFNNQGTLVGTVSGQSIGGYAQQHFDVGQFLGPGESGTVRVTPSTPNSVIGTSMFYFRDPGTGGITAMYGSSLREPFGTTVNGSYNLFIDMSNWLKITNVGSATEVFTVTVFNNTGAPKVLQLELAPNSGADLGLHQNADFLTTPASYGIVEIDSPSSAAIFAELLRIRTSPSVGIDFAAPTPIR